MLEENIGNLYRMEGLGKGFLNRAPFAKKLRPTIYKWDLIK